MRIIVFGLIGLGVILLTFYGLYHFTFFRNLFVKRANGDPSKLVSFLNYAIVNRVPRTFTDLGDVSKHSNYGTEASFTFFNSKQGTILIKNSLFGERFEFDVFTKKSQSGTTRLSVPFPLTIKCKDSTKRIENLPKTIVYDNGAPNRKVLYFWLAKQYCPDVLTQENPVRVPSTRDHFRNWTLYRRANVAEYFSLAQCESNSDPNKIIDFVLRKNTSIEKITKAVIIRATCHEEKDTSEIFKLETAKEVKVNNEHEICGILTAAIFGESQSIYEFMLNTQMK
jgi:hypothetical protein